MRDVISRHHAIILAALRHGPASAEQIADRLAGALQEHQVGKRLVELERTGRIEPTGELATNRSGRRARIFQAKGSTAALPSDSWPAAAELRPGDVPLPADTLFGNGRRRWLR